MNKLLSSVFYDFTLVSDREVVENIVGQAEPSVHRVTEITCQFHMGVVTALAVVVGPFVGLVRQYFPVDVLLEGWVSGQTPTYFAYCGRASFEGRSFRSSLSCVNHGADRRLWAYQKVRRNADIASDRTVTVFEDHTGGVQLSSRLRRI